MKRLAFLLLFFAAPAWSLTYYFGLSVPSTFTGSDFTKNMIVRNASGVHNLALALNPSIGISAFFPTPDGYWLFSPDSTVNLSGTDYKTSDIVFYNGSAYSLYLGGTSIGMPEYTRIDALFLDASNLVFSFDAPVALGGTDYTQSDLVLYNGSTFVMYWNAEAAGVPLSANIVGAARDAAGSLVVSFDVATTLGGVDYVSGQLVRWNGGTAFSNYSTDAAWPQNAEMHGLAFPPPSGGSLLTPLTISKAAGGAISLSWGTSCKSTDSDYEIYEGSIGTYYSHSPNLCSTGGATNQTILPGAGSAMGTYYLIVPRNGGAEGSYGTASGGAQIPQGTLACLSQAIAPVCN